MDVRMDVVHHPDAGHTTVMTGGVRIGSCTEEEMEVMDLLEMIEVVEREEKMGRVEREDNWRRNTPIPEQSILHSPLRPLRLCTVSLRQSTCPQQVPYAGLPSSPV